MAALAEGALFAWHVPGVSPCRQYIFLRDVHKTHINPKLYLTSMCTNKKVNEIFLIYKEIQMESGAKSYMRKGCLIYEIMRKHLTKYEEAVSHI
jgi:hypothetical protein